MQEIKGIGISENCCSHITRAVCEHEHITVLWNQGVLANRPDIIINNRTAKSCLLIDVAVPSDRNMMQKES